jgi:hypothetical protein
MTDTEVANQYLDLDPHHKKTTCRHCGKLVFWARRGGYWRVLEIGTKEFHRCPGGCHV